MTLPAGFPISMSQVAAELGLSLPLSIEHPWVLKLAQKSAAPLSLSNLLGKSAHFTGNSATFGSSQTYAVEFSSGQAPFFDGFIQEIDWYTATGIAHIFSYSAMTWWRGNILVRNNSAGTSAVIPPDPNQANHWVTTGGVAQIIRAGATDNFTILPSN